MVSGNIFHCRKNLWPPEGYISKSIVQLTGTGITELIALEMSKMTKEPIEESRKKIWLVDSKGLIVSLRINMSMSSVS